MERKKLKRIKKVHDCPNPLFEQWLTELRDEAAKRGQKTQYIYQKALTSLKKYPLPLKSGKDARILEFFGDKICQILDEKLAKHRAENGNISSGSLTENKNDNDVGICFTESPKKQKNVKTRRYVPTHRSGGYAITIALYHHMEKYGRNSYLKKSELIEVAQPFCDKSFKVPDPGGFYTAWNSMGVLIRKGLVIKESNPAKYYLTEAGIEMAEMLIIGQQSSDSNQKTIKSKTSKKGSSGSSSQTSSSSDIQSILPNINFPSTSESQSEYTSSQSSMNSCDFAKVTSQPLKRLEYCYVSDKGEMVHEKSKAFVIINDELSVGFLIKCKKSDLLQSGKKFVIDYSRPSENDYIFAFLSDNDTEEYSPLSSKNFSKDFENASDPILNQKDGFSNSSLKTKESLQTTASVLLPASQTESRNKNNSLGARFTSSFTLHPGKFEVILCVDNAETLTGATNPRKMMIQNDLRKNGISFDVRKLNVGDFAWVAREKVNPIPGMLQLPKAQELILDFIVERKRLDDLAGSIKDGRFHEQKFRLKTCGLRRPIYLVEGMGNSSYAKHYSIAESSLKQAVVNTQIIDEFTVKHTNDHAESVMYLTIMTRYLQSFYSNKVLISCAKEELTAEMPTADCRNCKLMTFEEFNSSSTKIREMTVKEIFAKQLLQLYGLSVEKALAIVEKYPTVSVLMSAYNDCASETEKEKLLSGIKYGTSKRNIGPAISKALYTLYCHSET